MSSKNKKNNSIRLNISVPVLFPLILLFITIVIAICYGLGLISFNELFCPVLV